MVQGAGQEVQLHLHPEWSDEARPPLLPEGGRKRPLISDYSVDEQRILINRGVELFREAGGPRPIAFRSGSFACNPDTFAAVSDCGILFDSSINPETPVSQPGDAAPDSAGYCEPFHLDDLTLVPMSSFLDGFNRARHAQIGACSAGELIQALDGAERNGWSIFVLLSHNFELMVPGKSRPDDVVVRRFEKVCRFLDENRSAMPTSGFFDLPQIPEPRGLDLPSVSKTATVTRYFEQGLRRIL